MKRAGNLLILIILTQNAVLYSQLSKGGEPYSFSSQFKTAGQLTVLRLEPVQTDMLLKEDMAGRNIKDEPWRFGTEVFVDLDIHTQGSWTDLPDGGRLWQAGITSPGAVSLNLTFDDYHLPEGASLFIYNNSHDQVLGAFTSENNQKDGFFATSLIFDDSIILEYYEPASVKSGVRLHLWRVTHGYRDIRDFIKSFGASGSCNVNAACPEGDIIRDQIRSVTMLIMGGKACTGTLINNTGQDGTPYVLSADHCFSDPGSTVFYFNWQSENCENPITSPAYSTLSGAVTRARYLNYDFWLLEMNDIPPDAYGVYYSGWNRTTTSSIGGLVYGIHHPSADIKKICWSEAGVIADYYLGNSNSPGGADGYWRVPYWSDNTTTEPGSSGSALFDKNQRVIGYLSGGHAACDTLAPDWYGRLGKAWTGGGNATNRLLDWLDPLSSGVTTLDGYDPLVGKFPVDAKVDAILIPEDSYLDTVIFIPTFVIRNNGSDDLTSATVSYRLTDSLPVSQPWSGQLATDETDTIIFPGIQLGFGKYEFIAKINVPGDADPANDSISKFFSIVDCGSSLLPISQGFNATSSFLCWPKKIINGQDADVTVVAEGQLPDCLPTEGARMLEFNSWSAEFGSVQIMSQPFSTVGFEDIVIAFDWHHDNYWSESQDKVIVQYSTDGESWSSVEEILRVNDTLSGWNRKFVTLPASVDNIPELYCGLLFVSDYGNNCHLDSLVISGTAITDPYADFYADPLVAFVDSTIVFTDASLNGPFDTWAWDFGAEANPPVATGQGPHAVSYPTVGLKTITLTLNDTLVREKVDFVLVREGLFPPKNLTASISGQNDVYLLWDPVKLFADNFESGNFSKWDSVVPGPGTEGDVGGSAFWHVSDAYSMDGVNSAVVNWGYDIDSRIITPELDITDDQILRFNWTGSYYWSVDPYQNADLLVLVSTDNGNTWSTLWQYSDIGVWESWVWYITTIDLSGYSGQKVRFAFNFISNEGADVAVDNVYIGDGFFIDLPLPVTPPLSSTFDETRRSADLAYQYIPLAASKSKLATFSNYSVYRNAQEITKTTQNSYIDYDVADGEYEYYVTSYYSDPAGESEPSNLASVIIVGLDPVREIPVSVYPNPGKDLFQVRTTETFVAGVYNSQGELLKLLSIQGNTSIDMQGYSEGVYYLRFTGSDNAFTVKIIKY